MLNWKVLVLTKIVCVVLDNMPVDAFPTAKRASQAKKKSVYSNDI